MLHHENTILLHLNNNMPEKQYPIFDITQLNAAKTGKEILNADRFNTYLTANPHLQTVHSHTFYHLVYFSAGAGSQVIDFEQFPVQAGLIYFMRPGQVHNWNFTAAPDGFIVNITPAFFDRFLAGGVYENRFMVFDGNLQHQVIPLTPPAQKQVVVLFESILHEQENYQTGSDIIIAALLMQLFVTAARALSTTVPVNRLADRDAAIMNQFNMLVNEHYRTLKLPRDYASLLFVTPHQLNVITGKVAGITAGDIIRKRIILEARRLLVNFSLDIADIADQLNFSDSSNFTKFFKKYTGTTPEQFRRQFVAG